MKYENERDKYKLMLMVSVNYALKRLIWCNLFAY